MQMLRKNHSVFVALLVGGAMLLVNAAAQATFVEPQSWDRNDPNFDFTYQHWDVFDDTVDQTPDVADQNVHGSASLSEDGGNGAFVTGGGNIYSFSAPTAFTVTVPEGDVPGPPHDVTAIVQIRTLGNELDYGSVKMNGLSPVDTAELFRDQFDSGFGTSSTVESWFLFNVPYADFTDGSGDSVSDLELTFNAAGSSMSLDQLAIDTAIKPFGFFAEPNPIPEPASLALLAAGGGMLMSRRRRG